MYNLGILFLLSCSEPKAPSYDLVTIVQNSPEGKIFVLKYLDKDKNGTVDFYGYGFGEETDIPSNPYSITSNEHFFVSAAYVREHDMNIKDNPYLKIMDADTETRINREYNQQRAYQNFLLADNNLYEQARSKKNK